MSDGTVEKDCTERWLSTEHLVTSADLDVFHAVFDFLPTHMQAEHARRKAEAMRQDEEAAKATRIPNQTIVANTFLKEGELRWFFGEIINHHKPYYRVVWEDYDWAEYTTTEIRVLVRNVPAAIAERGHTPPGWTPDKQTAAEKMSAAPPRRRKAPTPAPTPATP